MMDKSFHFKAEAKEFVKSGGSSGKTADLHNSSGTIFEALFDRKLDFLVSLGGNSKCT